jgi:hypothetical protein
LLYGWKIDDEPAVTIESPGFDVERL